MTYLILSRGAHYEDISSLLTTLNTTLAYMTDTYPSMQIIYRNTVPGHLNIAGEDRYGPPLYEAQNMTDLPYHWGDFFLQNHPVKDFLDEFYPQIIYLDVYTSTVLRRDSHCVNDGLHYCIPGPIDEWVVLLYNVLHLLQV